jgi:tripartite-type tricarboxylate transporter receptor subunit TctC
VLAKITAAMKKAMADPELRARLEKVGARPVGNSPAEFTAQIKREVARMKQLVHDRNIKLED